MLFVWICLGARLLVRRPAYEGDSRIEEEMTNAKTFINFQTAASGNRRERQLDLTTTNPPPCSGRSSASRGAKNGPLKLGGASHYYARQFPTSKGPKLSPRFVRAAFFVGALEGGKQQRLCKKRLYRF